MHNNDKNNTYPDRSGGEMRVRDLMGQRAAQQNRASGSGLDSILGKVSKWTDSLRSLFSGAKKSSSGAPGGKKPESRAAEENISEESDGFESGRNRIKQWIGTVQFRVKLFGGVDEADVWKKIGQLNRLYEQELLCERARYDALLEHYRQLQGDPDDSDDDEAEFARVSYDEYDEYDDCDDEADTEEEYDDSDEYNYSDY